MVSARKFYLAETRVTTEKSGIYWEENRIFLIKEFLAQANRGKMGI
jgi:hypothetical protein